MPRIVNFVCPVCKVHHVKDKHCTGDWHNTEWGVVLQSFCPKCGRMEPLISGEHISRNQLKLYAVRIAMQFDLEFDKCKSLAKSSDGVDFVHLFSTEFNIPPEEITSVINNGHDRK